MTVRRPLQDLTIAIYGAGQLGTSVAQLLAPNSRYEVRGPRAVPREPEAEYFPSEAPAPVLDEEGRRRKAEAKRKERGASEKKKAESQYKAGKRQRGGGSSWQQWDKDDD
jgi:3-hydroxyacyl-CoA dehydrogenase